MEITVTETFNFLQQALFGFVVEIKLYWNNDLLELVVIDLPWVLNL